MGVCDIIPGRECGVCMKLWLVFCLYLTRVDESRYIMEYTSASYIGLTPLFFLPFF